MTVAATAAAEIEIESSRHITDLLISLFAQPTEMSRSMQLLLIDIILHCDMQHEQYEYGTAPTPLTIVEHTTCVHMTTS